MLSVSVRVSDFEDGAGCDIFELFAQIVAPRSMEPLRAANDSISNLNFEI